METYLWITPTELKINYDLYIESGHLDEYLKGKKAIQKRKNFTALIICDYKGSKILARRDNYLLTIFFVSIKSSAIKVIIKIHFENFDVSMI
jgi:hypothetical protein